MDGAHEVRQVGVVSVGVNRRLVLAVRLDGLSEQRHLAHAALSMRLDLAGDLIDRSGTLASAPQRDDAVGAELVAALDYGHERSRTGLIRKHVGPTCRPELAAVILDLGQTRQVEQIDDLIESLRLGPGVDEGEPFGDRVVAASGVRSDHAAHDGDAQVGVGSLEVLQ